VILTADAAFASNMSKRQERRAKSKQGSVSSLCDVGCEKC